MKRQLGYYLYGAAVVLGMAWGVARGGLFTPADELEGVPRSVRDNPGAWRAVYRSHPRYVGGK